MCCVSEDVDCRPNRLKAQSYTPIPTVQAKKMQAEWQYMLVERMEPPTKTSGGLFLPSNEQVRWSVGPYACMSTTLPRIDSSIRL